MRESEKLRQNAGALRGGMSPRVVIPDVVGSPAPVGDPEHLRDVAADFRSCAVQVDQAGVDLGKLRHDWLPQAYLAGQEGEVAEQRMEATEKHAEGACEVLMGVRGCLLDLARQLELAQRQDTDAVVALDELYRDYQDTDNEALVPTMVFWVESRANAHERAEDAGIEAARALNEQAGLAVASQLQIPWLAPADWMMLAAVEDGVGPILSPSDAQRAAAALEGLDPAEQARFGELLSAAGSEHEQAWLLKALAAGNNLHDLDRFATTIHGRDDAWLQQQLRPIDPTRSLNQDGRVQWNGAALRQSADNTCGSLSLLLARASQDPVFALDLVYDYDQDRPVSAAEMTRRLAATEQEIIDETNTLHPQFLGTSPWGAANYMSDHTGVDYHVSWEPTGSDAGTASGVADAVAHASVGNPALLLVGNTSYPDHYIMVVGQDGDGNVLMYNSWGYLEPVPPELLHQEPLDVDGLGRAGFQRDRVYSVIAPSG